MLCQFKGSGDSKHVPYHNYHYQYIGIIDNRAEDTVEGDIIRVTRLGEISPFGWFFMALGEFFSRKNRPMIWAKF